MQGVADGLRFPAMELLMAIQMREFEIGVAVRPTCAPWHAMVLVEFLAIEEALPAHLTDILLAFG